MIQAVDILRRQIKDIRLRLVVSAKSTNHWNGKINNSFNRSIWQKIKWMKTRYIQVLPFWSWKTIFEKKRTEMYKRVMDKLWARLQMIRCLIITLWVHLIWISKRTLDDHFQIGSKFGYFFLKSLFLPVGKISWSRLHDHFTFFQSSSDLCFQPLLSTSIHVLSHQIISVSSGLFPLSYHFSRMTEHVVCDLNIVE